MKVRNVAKCAKCGDIIESTYTHDFQCCSCDSICVDGGSDYRRRCGNPMDFLEVTEEEYRTWKQKT
jgi:hypothetical protein